MRLFEAKGFSNRPALFELDHDDGSGTLRLCGDKLHKPRAIIFNCTPQMARDYIKSNGQLIEEVEV